MKAKKVIALVMCAAMVADRGGRNLHSAGRPNGFFLPTQLPGEFGRHRAHRPVFPDSR